MNSTKMFDAMSKIDDNLVERCINDNNETTDQQVTSRQSFTKKPLLFRLGIVIASVVLIFAIGSVTVVLAVEAKEYNTAVAFFDDNGLSTEGLTRAEVKAVYLDIKTKSFSYDKTSEVIQNAIPGWEIQQEQPTPEELEFWYKNYITKNTIKQKGISYRIRNTFDDNTELSALECYNDGKLIWNVEFSDFILVGFSQSENETVVYGNNHASIGANCVIIASIDKNGNVLWKESLDHGFKYESTASILKNDDGTWAVVTRGDCEYLCLSYYDNDGNELSFHKTEIGNLGIWNVARLGDGYIVQLGDMMLQDTAHLYKMDRDGNLTDDFSYEADGYLYFIQDMIEFGGKVYISAYYVPMNEGTHVGGSRPEIANILDYCLEREDPTEDIPSEELTPVVRKNFTAVLLICNPENGLLSTFYSVKGSLGAELSINDSGDLEWMVQSFLSTYYSPWTSSFTIGGICKEYCYEFDSAGNLVGQIDTNNQVLFGR